MTKPDTHSPTGPASAPYRQLAACIGGFMLVGAIAFLYLGLHTRDWRMWIWTPILLINAAGMFSVARTGRWFG